METVAWWFSPLYDDVDEWAGEKDPVREMSPLSTTRIDRNL